MVDPDSFELLPDDRVVRFTDAAGLVLEDSCGAISYVDCKTIGFHMMPDLKSLKHASEADRDNYQVVLRAVEAAGFELLYASERLRGKFELAEAAVEQDGMVMLLDNCMPEEFGRHGKHLGFANNSELGKHLHLAAIKSNRMYALCLSAVGVLPENEADDPDFIRAVLTAPLKTNDALIALLFAYSVINV